MIDNDDATLKSMYIIITWAYYAGPFDDWNIPFRLVQIRACRLVGTKPLSEPMLEYC